ncbi:MAG: hypothetical protein CFE21_16215 [Bacteroidetes bacterium B1(2017)]|nr:MAG: hypothetical protein CFE21_16215 [Bacteroidetes bacterium B1(2017)]
MPQAISITAILVDDEQPALDNLGKMLELYCPKINVIDTADSNEKAIKLINLLQPDVVFLDVNIHGKNGFDIVPQLSCKPFIVFVTAFEKYLLQALRISAVDYLLKPIDISELIQTEEKLVQLTSIKKSIKEVYHQSLNQLTALALGKTPLTKITLPNASGYESFELNQVMYVQGSDNYSIFHITGKSEKVVARTLKEYEDMLTDKGFMRVHKSYLINLAHVQAISKKDSLEIALLDGTNIPVSRRKAADVLDWFRTYAQGKNN